MASYSEIFNTNFKILRFLGFSTLKTNSLLKKKLYSLYQRSLLFIMMIFNTQQYIGLYIVRHEIEKFSYNFCVATVVTLIFFKALKFARIVPSVNALREKLNRNTEEENDNECEKILAKAAYEMKILNRLFHPNGFILILIMAAAAILDKSSSRNLPVWQWFPFDIQGSPNYELAFLYQELMCFLMANIELENNLSLFGFIISMSAEYEILEINLKKFNEIYKENMNNVENVDQIAKNAKVLEIIKNVAVRHQQITGQAPLQVLKKSRGSL